MPLTQSDPNVPKCPEFLPAGLLPLSPGDEPQCTLEFEHRGYHIATAYGPDETLTVGDVVFLERWRVQIAWTRERARRSEPA